MSALRRPVSRASMMSMHSMLDLSEVKADKKEYKLQKVDPTFEDKTGEYQHAFEGMLDTLDGKTSEGELCIEEYIVKSERAWFKKMREAKLGKGGAHRSRTPTPSLHRRSMDTLNTAYDPHDRRRSSGIYDPQFDVPDDSDEADEFLLGKDYERPSFLKRTLQYRIGDWPIYSFLLALGQILAANSYQITLLTGSQGETPEKLYIVGTIFIIASCAWWVCFRTLKSLYALSLPFVFYGLAFFLVGLAPLLAKGAGRDWMRNIATAMYVIASASGSIFFALNFGDEGKFLFFGSPFIHEIVC